MEEGGRRSSCIVQRDQTERREHENARKKAWRSRKDERKLGGEPIEAAMLRNGTSTSTAISAMFCGSAKQWLALGLKARGGPGRHCYLRGPMTCEASQQGETAWPNRSRGGVRCGHEVEEGPAI